MSCRNHHRQKLKSAMVETRKKLLRRERIKFTLQMAVGTIATVFGSVVFVALPAESKYHLPTALSTIFGFVALVSALDWWERAKKLLS